MSDSRIAKATVDELEPTDRATDSAAVPQVSLRALRKTFGAVTAVDGIDLDIADGEFFAMLGPSGSGKTTVLRMIAGFEQPTSGSVFLAGVDATTLPPFRRDVNTVFQDYALFPHMTVAQNVEYGLLVHRVPRAERARRVGEALDMVRLGEHGRRKPTQLSGGQRQRVALARALVNRPRVLLLDEPLGALDLKLREQMQLELKAIQREVGITFLFVTHDQDEALTLCDRLAVFNNGRIEQVGRAEEVYENPATQFVAGFVGSSNVISGAAARAIVGRDGAFAVRPEKISVAQGGSATAPGSLTVAGIVQDVVYAGSTTRIVVAGPEGLILTATILNAHSPDGGVVRRGDPIALTWHESAMRSINV
ncbi:ABC transporter ATP-binding protein [Lacisediminihabitans sp.]|uniref:ABC transporter ATP-binding protein n=1 Tax=Lacisediminihabitans sp. TaxID=2787631 RepID=UPI00374CE8D6